MNNEKTISVQEQPAADIVNAGDPMTNMLPDVVEWLPATFQPYWQLVDRAPISAALLVAGVFCVIAYILRSVLMRLLRKFASESKDSIFDEGAIQHLRKPLLTTFLFFGFSIATVIAQLPVGTETLVNIWFSIIVGSWMRSAFSLSTRMLTTLAKYHHRFPLIEPRTVPLLDLAVKLFTILVGSYALLMLWGINPLGWLASAGIVGIAVGFAAKDTLSNVFSGFFILIDSPYKIGDYVNLDSGERGCVTHIGLRSTRLLSREDIEITLPNAVIANAKIVNESGGSKPSIRITVAVGVAYGSDVDMVCEILQNVGDRHADTLQDPAPRVRMRNFGASSLDFELLGWIAKPEDRGRIRHELLIATYKSFIEHGIEIPYAKTDVYIKELPEREGASLGE